MAGAEGGDAGQGLAVQHVEPLALGGELLAPEREGGLRLGQLTTQEGDFIPEVGNQRVGGRWVARWVALGRVFGLALGRRWVGVRSVLANGEPHPPVPGLVPIARKGAAFEAHPHGLAGDSQVLGRLGHRHGDRARWVGCWVAVGTVLGRVGSVGHGRDHRTRDRSRRAETAQDARYPPPMTQDTPALYPGEAWTPATAAAFVTRHDVDVSAEIVRLEAELGATFPHGRLFTYRYDAETLMRGYPVRGVLDGQLVGFVQVWTVTGAIHGAVVVL